MGITFHKTKARPGRLHVGYRRGTWLKVWYEPIEGAEPDADGTVPIGLFQLMSGGAQRREPMEGEVAWEPHFDPRTIESSRAKERDRIQMQFLYDAWCYLNETDSAKEIELEEELHQPENRRWTSWFDLAKKDKIKKRRIRDKRKASRLQRLIDAQIDPATVEVNSDTSDDEANDSGYEDELQQVHAQEGTPMGPPPLPPLSGRKRKAAGGRYPTSKKSPKQRKKNRENARPEDAEISSLFFGGGSGIQDGNDLGTHERSPSVLDGRDGILGDLDGGESQISADFNSPSPQPTPIGLFEGRRLDRTSFSSGIESSRDSPLNGRHLTPLRQAELREKFKQYGGKSSSCSSTALPNLNGDLDDQAALQKAISETPLLRRLYSTPNEAKCRNKQQDPNQGRSILGHLTGLLFGHTSEQEKQSQEQAQRRLEEETSARPVAALLVPEVRKYIYKESPKERWRNRGFLRTAVHRSLSDGRGESPLDRLLAGTNGEIVFKDIHKRNLSPPSSPFLRNQERSGLEYQAQVRMRSFVQLLTTPTADTPGTTLLLHFDNKRYLIGSLAEGTQRACVQMGARLLKVSECFLTGRTEWKNTGGMIGMLLTLADSCAASQASSMEEALKRARAKCKRLGILDDAEKMRELEDEAKKESASSLNIFGPPNLNYTLATARRYVFRKGMPLHVHEIRDGATTNGKAEGKWDPFWADEHIKVWTMSVSPSRKAGKNSPAFVSPRKRSIDEVYAEENGTAAAGSDELTADERNYLTAKAIVSEMFNSSWRLDTLYETPLNEVKLPATIFVRNAQTNKIEKYTGPLPGGDEVVPNPALKVLVRRPWPGALVESLPYAEPSKEAISYIIRNHMQRGKFHPERAKQHNVPKGAAWAKLTKGESVTNDDGETITSEMVLDPSRVGGGIAVVDLPGKEYIDNLISRPEWREPAVMEGVGAIMWICGKDVATDARLHSFMEEFSHLEHVVSSPDYCPNNIALDSAAAATVRLKQVDPERYCIPVHDSGSSEAPLAYGGSSDFVSVREKHPLPANAHIAARGQVIQLEPAIEFQTKEVIPDLKIPETIAEIPKEVLEEAIKAQEAIRASDSELDAWRAGLPPGSQDAEIITLGTGSALPSKYRNVSATLVLVPNWGNVLLDCGENTLGQLKRVFNDAEFKQVLRDLRIITISHMHADHQLGTASVIKAWYEEVHRSRPFSQQLPTTGEGALDFEAIFKDNDRLAIISEPAMQSWLAEYSAVEDYGYSRVAPLSISAAEIKGTRSRLNWYIPSVELKNLSRGAYTARLDRSVVPASLLNLKDIQAVLVKHCHGARAMSLTMPSGFKVSYSGDCRPSKPFAYIGKGSTVCIHEATFDDELQGDAEAKNHSTTSEALGVAQSMRAKACVLTHFSQRYQKVPVLERDEQQPAQEDADGEDVPLTDGEVVGSVDESHNPDESVSGPLEDVAETFPDQTTSNGGRQYELPPKASPGAPAAVKFKLKSDMKVCVAFDYMRVRVGDIGHLEKFTPALLKLFAEEEKETGELQRTSSKASLKEGRKGKKKSERRN